MQPEPVHLAYILQALKHLVRDNEIAPPPHQRARGTILQPPLTLDERMHEGCRPKRG